MVANIKFATTTRSGKIRKPAIFLGFREDKKAQQVHTEIIHDPPKSNSENTFGVASRDGTYRESKRTTDRSSESNWPELEREPIRNQELFNVEDCRLTLHNVDRELWKGITKADLIRYYYDISKYLLPHVKERPLSLYVKLKGPNAPGLYIKDMEQRQPDCADLFTTARKHRKAGKRAVIDYLVCNNVATLLYTINLGCIDVNPWTSTTNNSLHPDFIIIDLDPSDGDFKKAVHTANAAKEFFDKHKLTAFPKTTGKTGIHIFIPCSSFLFPQARTVAEHICSEIHAQLPSITTTEVKIAERGSRLYIDPNQNDFADTVAAVYSVRPYKYPRVSTPLQWKELKEDLSPDQFTISTIKERVEKRGDLFLPVLDKHIAAKNDRRLKLFL